MQSRMLEHWYISCHLTPDLNPIEEAFAKLKAYLRANALAIQAVPDEELEDFILAGISCITKFDCAQWIQHSGYQ